MADLTQSDSLQKIIAQKDNEINDMMGTLNEIQEGFRLINEAENRVSLAKDGEGANKRQQLRENMQFIQQTMAKNRELINKLKKQLRESSVKGDQLNKTLEDLVAQLEQKDQQLQQLRSELDAKDIHIGKLDETIATLNTDVENLKTESSQKTETINTQDKQLNTAFSPRLISASTRKSNSTLSLPSCSPCTRRAAIRLPRMPKTSMCCASPTPRFSGAPASIW